MSDNDYWDRCIIESWEELLEYCVVIALAMDETHFAEDYKKKFNGAVLSAVQVRMGREKDRENDE
mgnify:CR=1 FL=1|jgi:hypothetical protein